MFNTVKQIILAFSVFIFLFSLACFPLMAAEAPSPTAKTSLTPAKPLGPPAIDLYLKKMDKKFDNGAVNFVAGWTEIIRQPLNRLKSEGKTPRALKLTAGLVQGILFAVADTAGGFFNTLTSPLPQFGLPLPQGGIKGSYVSGGKPVGYDLPRPDEEES